VQILYTTTSNESCVSESIFIRCTYIVESEERTFLVEPPVEKIICLGHRQEIPGHAFGYWRMHIATAYGNTNTVLRILELHLLKKSWKKGL